MFGIVVIVRNVHIISISKERRVLGLDMYLYAEKNLTHYSWGDDPETDEHKAAESLQRVWGFHQIMLVKVTMVASR